MAIKTSEIIEQLDRVASEISANRARLREAKMCISDRVTNLGSIPTRYADMLSAINAVGYGKDAFTNMNKAKLDALTAEFIALNAQAMQAQTSLATLTEF